MNEANSAPGISEGEARRQARRQRRRLGGARPSHPQPTNRAVLPTARPARAASRPMSPGVGSGTGDDSSEDEITTQFMSDYEHDALPPNLRGDRQELLELFGRMHPNDRQYGDFCYRLAFACWSDRDHRAAADYFAKGQQWETTIRVPQLSAEAGSKKQMLHFELGGYLAATTGL